LIDQIKQHSVGGNVGACCYLLQDVFIGKIIVIVMVSSNIEKTVSFEPEGLMNLKIKANGFHFISCFMNSTNEF
jgi:hypothetical protein